MISFTKNFHATGMLNIGMVLFHISLGLPDSYEILVGRFEWSKLIFIVNMILLVPFHLQTMNLMLTKGGLSNIWAFWTPYRLWANEIIEDGLACLNNLDDMESILDEAGIIYEIIDMDKPGMCINTTFCFKSKEDIILAKLLLPSHVNG